MDNSVSQRINTTNRRGIYRLYKSDEVVYVGKTSNVFSRIGQHVIDSTKGFDSYDFTPVSDVVTEFELAEMEFAEYAKYNLSQTQAAPINQAYKSEKFLRNVCRLNSITIVKKIAWKYKVTQVSGLYAVDEFLAALNEECAVSQVILSLRKFGENAEYNVKHNGEFIEKVERISLSKGEVNGEA